MKMSRWSHSTCGGSGPAQLRHRGVCVVAAVAPASPPRTKTLNLSVVHCRVLAAGVVIGRSKSTPRMVLGVLVQPGSQGGIGILRRGREGFVTLGGAVLPGHAAGDPFADPQHPLEVTNDRPPPLRV